MVTFGKPKTYVYVDGFNLYYGAVKDTPFRWLDIDLLCRKMLPKNHIARIKYFTAEIIPRPRDPQQGRRQLIYLRALETIPHLEIVKGRFLQNEVRMWLVNPTPTANTAKVIKTEEKGSDVNLATHLVVDAFANKFSAAVVISNDSDLALAIDVVRKHGLPVGVLNPSPKNATARDLCAASTFYKQIRRGVVRDSQFPAVLRDGKGTFTKPPSW